MTNNPSLPIPEDLEAQVPFHKSTASLARHYDVSPKTAAKWLEAKGYPRRLDIPAEGRRPMPDDFPERVQMLTFEDLKLWYKTGARCINRWKSQLKREGKPTSKPVFLRTVSAESLESAISINTTIEGVCRTLNSGQEVILRSANEHGIDLRGRLSDRRAYEEALEHEGNGEKYNERPHCVVRGAALTITSAMSAFDWEKAPLMSGSREEQLDSMARAILDTFRYADDHNLPLAGALGEMYRALEHNSRSDSKIKPDLTEVLRHWDTRNAQLEGQQ